MNLPTKILPKSVLDAVKHNRAVYQFGRRVRFAIGSRMGARHVPALGGRAHYNDFMLSSTDAAQVESYRRGACDFVAILGRSLGEAGRNWADIACCLEVGCGYGRIVRELRRELPADRIAVSDVIEEGARFTASEFGVRRLPVVESMDARFDAGFDLIYLLSVYTHLDRASIVANIGKVAKLLRPGGVLVFTTHGRGSAEQAERYGQYWLDKAKVLASLEAAGFYYQRYPYYDTEYGLTWIDAPEMRSLVDAAAPQLAFVAHHALALDGHQDVFVYRR
jgi:SAM-dependent methyltransferase